jgi:hypothetical protein
MAVMSAAVPIMSTTSIAAATAFSGAGVWKVSSSQFRIRLD